MIRDDWIHVFSYTSNASESYDKLGKTMAWLFGHHVYNSVQETYGEDPYLTGELVTEYVKGLQGDHPRYVRASAGCKHFAVYSGPEDIPSSRFSFDARVWLTWCGVVCKECEILVMETHS